ncbi:NACHT domain-containing protein [Saccharothrix syringae]|uniref:ATP-binding protein n=1 Tax=Saccharothrix syringae TaxID=103733 RepID=A0A5Q0H6C9_SACSY|nr:ATP-binding protein [Saccharothrix syringae]QFZ21776.1 ATP-binding protein [Saccharothrix syringae]
MPGGRPSQGKQQRYPELEELAAWFHGALVDAGFGSVHEFISTGLFEKNAVYGVFNAARLLTLESTQALAAGLKRDPAQVVDVWMRAKEARDRDALAQQRDDRPRLASWTDCPLPSLALRNLLEAQSTAVERLPYSLLGVDEPSLSTIYVRQQVRLRTTAEREDPGAQREAPAEQRPATTASQAALPVSEALERHDHLLVTGEPGAGKSTLGHHLARALSRVWLREDSATAAPVGEPVVPVRVSARSLDHTGSWSNVLAAAVSRTLGRTLVQDPDAGMFAGRAQGARWLILVDGLDEIPDPRVRGEVIRAVAQHARPGSDYRFVVTTRALPESELSPLRAANVGDYAIQPFARPELEQFAHRWFTAQNPATATREAERFLRETSDGRLRELVRNPLLATIAAVAAVKDPGRSLPTSRISLYERFCGYLAGDRGARREVVAHLRRRHHDDPARLACIGWLHEHRFRLLAALARERLETQDPLWPVARDWVRDQAGGTLVEGWEEHLWEELIGTGLLVAAERELRFLHQSFAEFLAARSHADSIGDDFTDLDTWIRRGLKDAERTFALFTFALWAAEPNHDIAAVITRVLDSYDSRRVLLAGHLIAEGVTTPTDTAEEVVNRLVALACNADDFDTAVEAIEILGGLFDHPRAAEHLGSMAAHPVLAVERRMAAVVALERLTGGEKVEPLLAELLPSCYGAPLRRAAPMALRLGAGVVAQVRQRALAMVLEPDVGIWLRVEATEVLADLGLVPDVKAMAETVFADRSAKSWHLRKVATAWHDAAGIEAVAEIAARAAARPGDDHSGRLELAGFLLRAGDRAAATALARAVAGDPDARPWHVRNALVLLLRLHGDSEVRAITDQVERWSAEPQPIFELHAGVLLKNAVEVTPHPALVESVRKHIERSNPAVHGMADLIGGWLATRDGTAQKVVELFGDGRKFYSFYRNAIAEYLNDAGGRDEAWTWAEGVLRSPEIFSLDGYRDAARLLLKIDPETAAVALTDVAAGRPHPPKELLVGVLDALDPDHPAAATGVAALLADHPEVSGAELQKALLVRFTHGDSAAALVDAILSPQLSITDSRVLARALAASGELDFAMQAWSRLLTIQEYSFSDDLGLIVDLQCAGVGEWAAGRMRALIADPATAPRRRLRLRQMVAALEVTAESTTEPTTEPTTA